MNLVDNLIKTALSKRLKFASDTIEVQTEESDDKLKLHFTQSMQLEKRIAIPKYIDEHFKKALELICICTNVANLPKALSKKVQYKVH